MNITLFDQIKQDNALRIDPRPRAWWLRLRLLTPVSHHDPGQKDKSNKSLFRREGKTLEVATLRQPPTQEMVDALLERIRVPLEVANLLQAATLPQFLGAAILFEFINLYGGREGTGLFSGSERYRYLEERFNHAAIQSLNLYEMWGLACGALQVPAPGFDATPSLLTLLSMPAALATRVLAVLAATPQPCVLLARVWADAAKRQNEQYAKAAGVEQADTQTVRLRYDVTEAGLDESSGVKVEMPAISANSLRHEMIREPGMWHLFNALDIGFDAPHPAITAMFYNGGDIQPGAVEPPGVFWIRKTIRDTLPLLALISGSADSFILGEGNLTIFSWIRCRENNDALRQVGLESNLSVFDFLDEWTLTRHANRVESGQMPFSFESLIAGTEIVVKLALSPYATDLQTGALMAALKTYQSVDATVGGQSARGFGLQEMHWHNCEFDEANYQAYESYLTENRDRLRAAILDGSLGHDRPVITAKPEKAAKGK